MSRIHEALKKAEEERAAWQGGAEQPSLTTPEERAVPEAPMVATGKPPAAASTGTAAAGVPPAMPSFASPFSVEALLARCARL